MYFEFNVLIVYREFTGEYKKQQFRFFAKSKAHAEKIARELLYLTDGIPEQDLQFVIKYVTPSASTVETLKQQITPILNKIIKLYENKDYKDYITLFKKKQGYGVKFGVGGKVKEYSIELNNLIVKVYYKDNMCVVDKDYLVYKATDKAYIFTDDMQKVMNCKVG